METPINAPPHRSPDNCSHFGLPFYPLFLEYETVRVKTSELTGAALDWAVAKCEYPDTLKDVWSVFRDECCYSTDWAQGGPIIERKISKVFRNVGGTFSAMILKEVPIYNGERGTSLATTRRVQWNASGPSPLIAAMRCYVASMLGDVVEIPEELTR